MNKEEKNTPEQLFSEPIEGYMFEQEDLIKNPVDTMDVTKKLYGIRAVERKIEQLDKARRESILFYTDKIKKLMTQEEWLKGNIHGFLNANGLDNISTPAGSAHISKREKWEWSEDDEKVLAWCKANAPDCIETSECVSYTKLRKHIKDTQIVPGDVVTIQDNVTLTVKSIT